jgi:hypothetical protein
MDSLLGRLPNSCPCVMSIALPSPFTRALPLSKKVPLADSESSMRRPSVVTVICLHLLERFDRANDRTMLVVHGHGAQADGNLVSGFVLQKTNRLRWLGGLDGSSQRAVLVAKLAARPVAMQDGFPDARVAYDFMPQVARDALGPVAPEHNFLLHVDDAHAGGQAIDDASTNVDVMK